MGAMEDLDTALAQQQAKEPKEVKGEFKKATPFEDLDRLIEKERQHDQPPVKGIEAVQPPSSPHNIAATAAQPPSSSQRMEATAKPPPGFPTEPGSPPGMTQRPTKPARETKLGMGKLIGDPEELEKTAKQIEKSKDNPKYREYVHQLLRMPMAAYGIAENVLNMATDLIASLPAEVAGMYVAAREGDKDAFATAFHEAKKNWVYDPRTEQGKAQQEALNGLFEKYETLVNKGLDSEWAEKNLSPAALALAKTIAIGGPLLLPFFKGRIKAEKAAEKVEPKLGETPEAPKPEFKSVDTTQDVGGKQEPMTGAIEGVEKSLKPSDVKEPTIAAGKETAKAEVKKSDTLMSADEIAARKKTDEVVMSAKEIAERKGEQVPEDEIVEFGSGPMPSKKSINKALDKVFGKPAEHRDLFNPIRDAEQTGVERWHRAAVQIGDRIRKAIPNVEDRKALTLAMQKGDFSALTEAQKEIVQKSRDLFDEARDQLLELDKSGAREHYVPQIWDMKDPKTKAIIDEWQKAKNKPTIDENSVLGKLLGSSGMRRNPFTMERALQDYESGMKLGLKPKDLDYANLFETYFKHTGITIERAKTARDLKKLAAEDGTPMAITAADAPPGYVQLDGVMRGWAIHPDIAPAVNILMKSDNPSMVGRAVQTISFAAKRGAVSYTGFHLGNLYTAWLGTGGNPFRPIRAVKEALRKYREGPLGDDIDNGVKHGLALGAPLEDILGRDRYLNVLKYAGEKMSKVGLGAPLRGMEKFDALIQKLTFDQGMTGFKIDAYLRMYESEMAKNLRRAKPLSNDEIATAAAKATNDIFGGQNWERALDAFDRPQARKIMSEVMSRTGKRWMQSVAFAPDWLVSTVSAWTHVTDKSAVRRAIHQRYIATSAAYLMVVGNVMQYAISGHSMFENEPTKKDPSLTDQFLAKTRVQLPNGQYIQLNKHLLEVPHLVADPSQWWRNKLAILPREFMSQTENRQFLVPSDKKSDMWPPKITEEDDSPMEAMEKRTGHVAKQFLPFTAVQGVKDPLGAALGVAGFPVYGMTKEEKEEMAEKAKAKRKEDRKKRHHAIP